MDFVDVEGWLHGWEYSQEGILRVHSQEFCVGCGYEFQPAGTGCYVIDENTPFPPKGFPFNMQRCPLCKLRNRNHVLEKRLETLSEGDPLTRRMEALARAREGKS